MSSSQSASLIERFFLKPGASNWEPLQLSASATGTEAQQDAIKRANELLKNTLLQSLQMQHLILLAGSGCSLYAGGPSMANLWNAVIDGSLSKDAIQFASQVKYDLSYQNIEAFLSQIEAYLSFCPDTPLQTFLKDAQSEILKKCSQFIESANLDAHKRLLHRLSRRRTRDQRLRVFTTNYDVCFERAAASIGCVAMDGFSFMAPRQYDPRYFDYDIIRRARSGEDSGNYLEGVFQLYKLHGSVNWEKSDDGTIREKEIPNAQKACLIYPARGKYQQSYNQPYIESISQYLAAIREPNTCLLVVGFGFNDDHLSGPLVSAVRSNPHLRLIVIDPNLKENTVNSKNSHLRTLLDLSANGDDVWLINESFEGIANSVPDLKSLTPAERLANVINGMVQQA